MDMETFARTYVDGHGFARSETFPDTIWRALAAAGLFRIGLPQQHGGSDGGYAAIAAGEQALAQHGGVLGLTMSWTGHQLVARHCLVGFASPAQCAHWLPRIADGSSTASVAISEPGVGAHPRDLKTVARRDGTDWLIDGEKAWVTNGPIADLFVVLAITSVASDRKRYSAFLVPRGTDGLALLDMPPLPALRPSPHCRLRLSGCRVPAGSMLGPPDIAYETMALPFRDIEDAVGVSGICGLADHILRGLAAIAGPAALPELQSRIGEIAGLLALLRHAAHELAVRLDAGNIAPHDESLLIGARALTRHIVGCLERLRDHLAPQDPDLLAACADLAFTLDIARGPRAIKQARLGAARLRPTL